VTQWVLGVRPDWDGLRIDPCLPPEWNAARMARSWRGCAYDIRIQRVSDLPGGTELALDGLKLASNVVPVPGRVGERHEIRVRCA
jgi:cellobiose phosphorylase